MSYSGRK